MADKQLTFFSLNDKSKPHRRNCVGNENPNWKGGKVRLTCSRCGQRFEVIPSRADKARFCSLSCFNEYQKETHPDWVAAKNGPNPERPRAKGRRKDYIEIACRQCSSRFEIPPSHVSIKIFCSRKCHMVWRSDRMRLQGNPRWKGGIGRLPYAPEWPHARKLVRKRDGNACLNPLCKRKSTKLVVHHIDYDKKNCHLSNLITVCVACNSEANRHRKKWMLHYQSIQEARGILPSDDLQAAPVVPDTPGRKGSKHHLAKLQESDIAEIFRCKANGEKNRRLAERFNVSEATISNIVHGKNWTHVSCKKIVAAGGAST